VSTLAEVFSQLRAVLGRSEESRRALSQAGNSLGEASRGLAEAVAGSGDPDAEDAVTLLGQARDGADDACRTLFEAEDRVRAYLSSIGGRAADIPAPAPSAPERIEQLRAQLPPPVASGAGQKTHGRWIDPDGRTHAEVSGKDARYDEAI
jgi:hypothetical protein